MKRSLSLSLLLSLLLLAACSQTTTTSLTEDAASPLPLLTDSDIDAAHLALADLELELVTTELELPEAELRDVRDQMEPDAGSVTTQAVFPHMTGWLTYVRHTPDTTRPWQIMVQDQATGRDLVIYRGLREIQSVAVDAVGEVFVFSMRKSDGVFAVYRYIRSSRTLSLLVNSAVDNLNVSLSADGNTVVWEGGSPKRIFIRDYQGGSFTQSLLRGNIDFVEPSVSADGNYIAHIRVLSATNRRVFVFNRSAATNTLIFRDGINEQPSVSDGGLKVVWVQPQSPTHRYLWLRDMAANSNTLLTVGEIAHPHISGNGGGLTYSDRHWNGSINIYTLFLNNSSSTPIMRSTDSEGSVQDLAPFCHCAFPTNFWDLGYMDLGGSIRDIVPYVEAGTDGYVYAVIPRRPYNAADHSIEIQKRRQDGTLVWSMGAFMLSSGDYAYALLFDVALDPRDNSLAILGNYSEVRKYDSDGNPMWQAHEEEVYAVTVDGNGNTIMVGNGYSYSNDRIRLGTRVVKYSPQGTLLWRRSYYFVQHPNSIAVQSVVADAAGNIYLAGYRSHASISPEGYAIYEGDSIFIQKVASDGSPLWYKQYLRSNEGVPYIHEMLIGQDGQLYFVGSAPRSTRMLTAKVDAASGGLLWNRRIGTGTNGRNSLYGLTSDSSGNLYVAGSTAAEGIVRPPGNAGIEPYIIKYSPEGVRIWHQQLDLSAYGGMSGSYSIAADTSDKLWLIGHGTLIKMNTDGYLE